MADQVTMAAAGKEYKSIAYFVNWAIYARNHNPQDLPAKNLTHVLYSFANVKETGEVFLTDAWSDTLYLLKKNNRNLKVLLSIGGWTYSANFPKPASTPEGRSTFASTAVRLVKDLGLDGLDVDWEYPKDAGEAQNYVDLLAAIRKELDTVSKKMQLSVACAAGPKNYEIMKLKAMDQYLDMWNLMAYDYAGSWDATSGHQANLYPSKENPASTPFSTDAAVKYYTSHGVKASKIVLGMPIYGRAFLATDGPGKKYTEIGEGSYEKGIWDFKALPKDGAKEFIDKKIGASWSYDAASKMMVTYDTKEMVQQKAEYIKKEGLGGGMWWESSADKKDGESLIGTVAKSLGSLDRSQNTLSYPDSKYDNLKKGMP
ncbi:MAG: hypothetical protein L6R36_001991 [Xanthoria steineri]|nr:MAG: hypothetical protein L6R36_001991 [Xanthoria steineri]